MASSFVFIPGRGHETSEAEAFKDASSDNDDGAPMTFAGGKAPPLPTPEDTRRPRPWRREPENVEEFATQNITVRSSILEGLTCAYVFLEPLLKSSFRSQKPMTLCNELLKGLLCVVPFSVAAQDLHENISKIAMQPGDMSEHVRAKWKDAFVEIHAIIRYQRAFADDQCEQASLDAAFYRDYLGLKIITKDVAEQAPRHHRLTCPIDRMNLKAWARATQTRAMWRAIWHGLRDIAMVAVDKCVSMCVELDCRRAGPVMKQKLLFRELSVVLLEVGSYSQEAIDLRERLVQWSHYFVKVPERSVSFVVDVLLRLAEHVSKQTTAAYERLGEATLGVRSRRRLVAHFLEQGQDSEEQPDV